jgi:endogenous inhibitor of DNA gyrase (YacG/DUF329 family)
VSENGETPNAGKPAAACPTCGKPAVPAFRPFCSARCRDVDLHRWFSGRYAIPVTEDTDEDGTLPETGAPGIVDDPESN